MFEVRPTADLIQIANAGGGFEIRVSVRPTADLVQIAAAAANGGGTIFMRGLAVRPTAELVQIARAGQGHVVFADPLPEK